MMKLVTEKTNHQVNDDLNSERRTHPRFDPRLSGQTVRREGRI